MKCIKHQFTWVSGTPHNCLPLDGFCKIPNWKLISDPFERQSKYDVTLVSRPPRIQTLAIHLSFYRCFFPQPLWRISMPLFDCQTVSGQSAHCLRTQSFIKIFIELSVAQIGWSQTSCAEETCAELTLLWGQTCASDAQPEVCGCENRWTRT